MDEHLMKDLKQIWRFNPLPTYRSCDKRNAFHFNASPPTIKNLCTALMACANLTVDLSALADMAEEIEKVMTPRASIALARKKN